MAQQFENMKSMNCRGGTAGVELALIAALLPAPSRPMWPQNGVRQAGTTSFVQNQNVARLSHPYGLDHISNGWRMASNSHSAAIAYE